MPREKMALHLGDEKEICEIKTPKNVPSLMDLAEITSWWGGGMI
jgi:hypothetical protein